MVDEKSKREIAEMLAELQKRNARGDLRFIAVTLWEDGFTSTFGGTNMTEPDMPKCAACFKALVRKVVAFVDHMVGDTPHLGGVNKFESSQGKTLH